ncbi:hypothetical protein CK203_113291 [Vitis vinifera]|uniref:Uncharacterized protein n=1 Tax=Vitis vinifera TaxID=29760 RepID=A0A438ECU9_VITVI|nr:hypothetical protein CK203_113291 [Vitis vinifera]
MLFMATGKDEVLALIQSLNIQLINPVLPTRCSENFKIEIL